MINQKRTIIIAGVVIAIIIILAGVWFFFLRAPGTSTTATSNPVFSPLNTQGSTRTNTTNTTTTNQTNSTTTISTIKTAVPTLRIISSTPIGGYSASTTGTTTVVRWVDRGRGNVYQTQMNGFDVQTVSNTLLPRVYNSIWNTKMTAFIASILADDSETPSTVYAELRSSATTSSSLAPQELRGRNLPTNTIAYAVSPKKDQVFILVKEGIGSTGYVSSFDGSKTVQIFTTPLTQLNVDWPTDTSIAITTKGISDQAGYLYLINSKTGVWSKVLGPLNGLSARVSHDGKHVLYSTSDGNDGVTTKIYTVSTNSSMEAMIHTLADKCVWGNFYKDMAYCAVPFQNVAGAYPDDWYKGVVSPVDKIWQINSATNELHIVNPLIGQAKTVVDAFNLGLDNKDNYLFFMNKNDLSLWSVDLVKSI